MGFSVVGAAVGPAVEPDVGPDVGADVGPDVEPDVGTVVGAAVGPVVRPVVGPVVGAVARRIIHVYQICCSSIMFHRTSYSCVRSWLSHCSPLDNNVARSVSSSRGMTDPCGFQNNVAGHCLHKANCFGAVRGRGSSYGIGKASKRGEVLLLYGKYLVY